MDPVDAHCAAVARGEGSIPPGLATGAPSQLLLNPAPPPFPPHPFQTQPCPVAVDHSGQPWAASARPPYLVPIRGASAAIHGGDVGDRAAALCFHGLDSSWVGEVLDVANLAVESATTQRTRTLTMTTHAMAAMPTGGGSWSRRATTSTCELVCAPLSGGLWTCGCLWRSAHGREAGAVA